MSWRPPEAYEELTADVAQILLSGEEIAERVVEIGRRVSEDYAGRNPLLVGVLKGVVPFIADLLRVVTVPAEVDYMAISNYSPDARDQGLVRLTKDLEVPIRGRHVLFVEDVIDTGLTLSYLLRTLRAREPASLEVCVLFNKPKHRLVDVALKYKGFDLPDKLVVGWGLDYREQYRNLPFVGLLKPEVFQDDVEG
jgi:hypoxanthine phosphoribosyltransferase